MIGRTLSHYKIVAKLGAGGMGDVYAAEDTKLGRRVALKVLPPELAENPERLERFQREARTIASLNHPNIVTIHSVEEAEGLHFLTMELIEGRSLAELIPEKGLPLERIFAYGIPLAEAMSAAHRAGITHRDLKPANVMLSEDGRIKVLDFGLAKAAVRTPSEHQATMMTGQSVTGEGRILGTVAYMSPEQAEGKPIDPRSDIFSMGVLLYEMTTGRRPFQGDSDLSTLSAILRDTPPTVTSLKVNLPRPLGHIVKRCLAKEPDRRYQTALDLRNELQELKEELDSGEIEAPAALAAGPAASRPAWLVPAAIAGVGLLAAVTFWALRSPGPGGAGDAAAFPSMKITRVTSTGKSIDAAISPHGRYVAHVYVENDSTSLWVTQISTGSAVQIVRPDVAELWDPTFSPDGEFVYYVHQEKDASIGSLYRIPVLGGEPRKLLDEVNSTISFSPDGSRFAFLSDKPQTGVTEIAIANADGSGRRMLAERRFPEMFNENPSWSPDGRIIAAPVFSLTDGIRGTIVGLSPEDGSERRLTEKDWFQVFEIAWLPDGSGLVLNATESDDLLTGQLWLLSQPSGRARKLTNDLNAYNGVSVTADGERLVTGQDEASFNLWIHAPGGDAPRQITHGREQMNGDGIAWTSDDGIVYSSSAGGSLDLWAIGADGSGARQLTRDESIDIQSAIGRNDDRIVFVSNRSGKVDLWRMPAGGGAPEALTELGFAVDPDVSPDGTWIVFMGGKDQSLFKLSVEGGEPVRLTEGPSSEPIISPDGSRIAYRAWDEDAKRFRTLVIPFEGGEAIISLDIPSSTHDWSPAGDAIDYAYTIEGVTSLWRQPLEGGPPARIESFGGDQVNDFAWSPDGTRLAVSRGTISSDVLLLAEFR